MRSILCGTLPMAIVMASMSTASAGLTTGHIPVGSSSLAASGQDAVRFEFSQVVNSIGSILHNLDVADHIYQITNAGYVKLYLKSSPFNPDDIPKEAYIAGTMFSCSYTEDVRGDFPPPYGRVIKYLSESMHYSGLNLPERWNDGKSIILYVNIPAVLPIKISIKCGLQLLASTSNVKVSASFKVRKIGCPRDYYGYKCLLPCVCENGGECHTFKGQCICPEYTNGTFCETDLRTGQTTKTNAGVSVQDSGNQAEGMFRKQSNISHIVLLLLLDFLFLLGVQQF